jgi:hypothetical protein
VVDFEGNLFRAALAYADRSGFAVFPCQQRQKTPLTQHGFKDVIAPPSVHSNGQSYQWKPGSRIDEVALNLLPSWLTKTLTSPVIHRTPKHRMPSSSRAIGGSVSSLDLMELAAGVVEGHRDDQLFSLGMLPPLSTLSARTSRTDRVDTAGGCRPPFPTYAALRKVDSAWRCTP